MAKESKPTSDECKKAAKTVKKLVAYVRGAYPQFAIPPKNIFFMDCTGDALFTFADYFRTYPNED